MRLADAPQAGWYPDPEGSSRLRWWDGADWSDRFRSRPVNQNFLVDDEVRAKLKKQKEEEERIAAATAGGGNYQQVAQQAAQEAAGYAAQQYGDQAQQYAQQQWQAQQQRASQWAQQQSRQARQVAQQYSPLISQQAANVGKFAKRLIWLIVVLVVSYWFLRLLATGVISDLIEQIQEDQTGAGIGAGVGLLGRYRSAL